MHGSTRLWVYLLFAPIGLVLGQGQQCYIAAGAKYRAPENVIPCSSDGPSACCLQGDTCLSGNACWNFATGNTYQYGCTDETYTDATCPYKCGWDPDKSPWTALEYCDADGVDDTWTCHSPESCGCSWNQGSWDMLELPFRGCAAMGSEARAALYAPASLAPWVSLPKNPGGSTGYFPTTTLGGKLTWSTTAIKGYTPDSIGPYVTYDKAAPTTTVVLFPGVTPQAATLGSVIAPSGTPNPVSISGTPSTSAIPSTSSSASSSITSSVATRKPSTHSTTTKTTSSTTSSSGPTHTSSPSLTTGAKVGIGIGVAGGVCLLAAIALVSIIFRRRRSQSQNSSTGTGPDEKYTSWQSQPYPPGGSPDGYHYNQRYQYQGVPAMIHEATYSAEDERTVQKRMSPLQPPPPVEMQGDYVVPEADSRSASRVRPNYEETDITKRPST